MSTGTTFIDDLDDVVEIVSSWAADLITEVIDALSPDGRAFGQVKLTPNEEMDLYHQYRGSPDAWLRYIDALVNDITSKLSAAGMSAPDIASIHPYDIALKMAYKWSAEMEGRMSEGMTNGLLT